MSTENDGKNRGGEDIEFGQIKGMCARNEVRGRVRLGTVNIIIPGCSIVRWIWVTEVYRKLQKKKTVKAQAITLHLHFSSDFVRTVKNHSPNYSLCIFGIRGGGAK